MTDLPKIESKLFRRRGFLTASLAGSAAALWPRQTAANPFSVTAGGFFRGAVSGAGSFLGATLMEWLIDAWQNKPQQLPNTPPPNWGQNQPPQSGWNVPTIPPPWLPPAGFPNWQPAWPGAAPVVPPYFRPPPEFITLWLSEQTGQIYEVRTAAPYFVFTPINDRLAVQVVGGGVGYNWRLVFLALGDKQGPFSVGSADVFTDWRGNQRLIGDTSYASPTGWIPAAVINWRRIR